MLKLEESMELFPRKTFGMCHAGSFNIREDGSFSAAFFAGTYEGANDTAIYLVNGALKGQAELHEPVCVAKGSKAHWNPVLFTLKDGRECLFYKVGDVIAQWSTYIMFSFDKCQSFTASRELVKGDKGGRGPVRNKPVYLKSGRILCPGSLEQDYWRSFVDISDDELETLHMGREVAARGFSSENPINLNTEVSEQSFSGTGVIQPSLWEDDSGVHMLMRSSFGKVLRADSSDEGESFCKPYAVNLPNNNSGLDAVFVKGVLYVCCNPVSGNWALRTPLTILSSKDGINFKEELVLESGEGEFSYPCIKAAGDTLYVSYTFKRETIKFLRISITQ